MIMEKKNQNSFSCKNYYKMPLKEVEEYINRMQNWLFTYKEHPNTEKVRFALGVAIKARELKREGGYDDIIDNLT